jgi:pimeloyl-ACP methyl ester carboxylesterase
MPYVSSRGVRIYYEVAGQGPPLILAHAFRRNLNRWRETGVADALKNDYRLILFDARGHGKSDRPHEPAAYGLNMVEDVISVIDDLHISWTNYFGYSMGAGVGFKAAVIHPDRFSSFVLGGFDPYPAKTPPSPGPRPARVLPSDPEAFIRLVEQTLGRPLTNVERQFELSNDLATLNACIAGWNMATFDDQALSCISVPCLLYAGELDPAFAGAREASRHIPGARFLSFPGLDHAGAGPNLEYLPRIIDFLADVTKTG